MLALRARRRARRRRPPSASVRACASRREDARGSCRFVASAPGQPLDPEAVRRAVELIFATGRFEDVRVELVRERGRGGRRGRVPADPGAAARDGAGRGRPRALGRGARAAPRACGRASRSGRRASSAAGRDVALALGARGYLEALVSAEAARAARRRAVFRVHAGPRVRVVERRVECADAAPRAQLAALVRPRPGEVYEQGEGRGRARGDAPAPGRGGYWRAEVELARDLRPRARRG